MNQTSLGPFVLGKVLGKGSSGFVRLGHRGSDDHPLLAFKFIDKTRGKMTFHHEVAMMRSLRPHVNVLQLVDTYHSHTDHVLILEYAENGDLLDFLLENGKLPESKAREFFSQILHGTQHLHHHNICHRDIKPENVLLDKKYNVKIADFGLACRGKWMTTGCGSTYFASPEMVSNAVYDGHLADIWSCGVVLYCLLSVQFPYDNCDWRNMRFDELPIPEWFSNEITDLTNKILERDPAKRLSIPDILRHQWFLSDLMPGQLLND